MTRLRDEDYRIAPRVVYRQVELLCRFLSQRLFVGLPATLRLGINDTSVIVNGAAVASTPPFREPRGA